VRREEGEGKRGGKEKDVCVAGEGERGKGRKGAGQLWWNNDQEGGRGKEQEEGRAYFGV
jgi:hypothetical protein